MSTASNLAAFSIPAVCARASELGLLTIVGEDAPGFLHGQLSSDVNGLAPGRCQWSSYNSPKGRTLATLRLWRAPDASGPPRFGALLGADLAAPMAKRLAMFVLRSKVRVSDETDAFALFGIGGERAAFGDLAATLPPPDHAVAIFDGKGTAIGLGDGRTVIATSAGSDAARALDAGAVAHDPASWRLLGILAGAPLVTAATSDRFIPQMLNLDALGAISFDKGCYPGQEIVARTRYRAQVRERLFGLHAPGAEPPAGTRIFSPVFADQPCGTVINAAPAPSGGSAMLAVVQIEAVAQGTLALDAIDGPPLEVRELPYALPDDSPSRPRLERSS